ncbi:hypothetical protein [Nonomuraea pusilla]|uniref:hypothetical protein n=1 Tax=Nonomuraea pusilla TaxID=46177 RepID=UPI001160BC38|nr:hypothetical protein [Nonomuraea pusilla]
MIPVRSVSVEATNSRQQDRTASKTAGSGGQIAVIKPTTWGFAMPQGEHQPWDHAATADSPSADEKGFMIEIQLNSTLSPQCTTLPRSRALSSAVFSRQLEGS